MGGKVLSQDTGQEADWAELARGGCTAHRGTVPICGSTGKERKWGDSEGQGTGAEAATLLPIVAPDSQMDEGTEL